MVNSIKLITTTSHIEGWEINKYYGIITYQMVVGTNLFKDISASIRDVFGGSSLSYQKELQKLEKIVLTQLKKKAMKMGANLILGVRLDFDEISGGGKSMFMLSASGTAAFGKTLSKSNNSEKNKLYSFEQLNFEIKKNEIRNKLKEGKFELSKRENLNELIRYRVEDVEKVVKFINSNYLYVERNETSLMEYFSILSMETIRVLFKTSLIIEISNKTFEKIVDIFTKLEWFDFEAILILLKCNNHIGLHRALRLLQLNKSVYGATDIQLLTKLKNEIIQPYSIFPLVVKDKKLLGKEKEKWKCINCGASNDLNNNGCSNPQCGANIYGIPSNKYTPDSTVKNIDNLINQLNILFNS